MRKILLAGGLVLAAMATVGTASAQDRHRYDRHEYDRARYDPRDDDRWDRRGIGRGEAVSIARRYGIVRIEDIERDDDGWEIEGRDRRGREIEIEINSRGRVTDVDYDD